MRNRESLAAVCEVSKIFYFLKINLKADMDNSLASGLFKLFSKNDNSGQVCFVNRLAKN